MSIKLSHISQRSHQGGMLGAYFGGHKANQLRFYGSGGSLGYHGDNMAEGVHGMKTVCVQSVLLEG